MNERCMKIQHVLYHNCKSQGRLLYECHREHSRDGFGLKVYNDIKRVTTTQTTQSQLQSRM